MKLRILLVRRVRFHKIPSKRTVDPRLQVLHQLGFVIQKLSSFRLNELGFPFL